MVDKVTDENISILLVKLSRRFDIPEENLKEDWKAFNTNSCYYILKNAPHQDEMCSERTYKIAPRLHCQYHKHFTPNHPEYNYNSADTIEVKKVTKKKVNRDRLIIMNTEIGKFIHPATSLVFENKRVIGYYDGLKVLPLN